MMWARLIGVMPLILGGAVCAQSANEIVTPLESCFRTSRRADAICMRQNDPAQRLDCLRKASAAQLQCLEHTLPKGTAASKDSSKTVPSGAPGHASEIPSSSPIQPGRTESMGVSNGRIPANEFDSPPKADPKTNPRPDVPGQRAAVPAQTNWTFTTSPDPRRTLVTAVIHATPVVKNGPNTLTIACRGRRTDVSVGMEGELGAPRKGKPQIDLEINDQPAVRRRWAWSANRKLASYKDDPIGLLQSFPDDATLKIAVSDRANARHEATFQLSGFDLVRKKVAMACKWAPVQAQTSSGTR